MAYYGAVGGSERPYAGSAALPPGARGHHDGPAPPSQQHAGRGPYDGYHDGYGYDDRDRGGYGQGYAKSRGPPPPQDHYAPGPGNRGAPAARPPPGGRGMPGPGRNGAQGGPYPSKPEYDAGRQPPLTNGQSNRRDPAYAVDQDLSMQMSGMAMNGQPSRPQAQPGASSDGYYGRGDYGRPNPNGNRGPPPRDYPQDGYGDSRRPSPPRQGPNGYGGYGGYGEDYQSNPNGGRPGGFGPPSRSMTMPVQDSGPRHNVPLPQRNDTMPLQGPAGRGGGIPPRPSTASGNRPPPRRMYPPQSQQQPQNGPGGGYSGGGRGYGHDQMQSSDDVFNSYFDNSQGRRSSLPDGDAAPPPRRGASLEQQRGPHQTPRLHHARSEANFREPQAAVLEMAGDIPGVPPVPHIKPYQPEFADGYGRQGGFDPMAAGPPRGPGSAPAGPVNGHRPGGFAGGDVPPRSATAAPQSSNPDALPSHPTPVRPGLMANSMVSLADRPPPVRNYGAMPQAGPAAQSQPLPHQQRMVTRAGHRAPEPAQLEDSVTPQELEHLRMVIKHNANDQESALKLARKLMEAADVLAPKMPDAKQRAKTRERYLLDGHKILKKLANAQNAEAMFVMADGLGQGLFGHEPDNKEAFTLYQSAAKLGHAAAAYRTAVCCEIGHEEGGGTRKDPLKAMQWYKRAATLGDPPAMYKVGMILLKGLLGQPKNPREAVGWLKRAAERANAENPHALHELGLLYESAQPNDAIIRDERYALSLFQEAAELGYKFSQFRLGCVFEYGLMGCPIDPRQSIFWYSKAASQEEHQSELALSGWYLTGSEGVLGQSDTEAYLWARKAAVAGLAKAEYAMGYFTEVGIGVPANLEDAKRWYWRAAAQEFPKARERLEDLKRAGKHGRPRQRERISRSRIEKQQEGECSIM
ncbi:hypothetical protein CDD83_9052 [Cordyceps sp. RAO-2017]|nr:hypothetical protein CDD83_9052 [Cordyceps sp. RAO-2017]